MHSVCVNPQTFQKNRGFRAVAVVQRIGGQHQIVSGITDQQSRDISCGRPIAAASRKMTSTTTR